MIFTHPDPVAPGEPMDRDGYAVPHGHHTTPCRSDGYGGCQTPTPTRTHTVKPSPTVAYKPSHPASPSASPTAVVSHPTQQPALPVTGPGNTYVGIGVAGVLVGVIAIAAARKRRRA